jgi:mRNA interferase YafQ
LRRTVSSSRFRKDLKRLTRRGLDSKRLANIIEVIQRDGSPPASARPHLLIGDWAGHLECQIAPDWLLIYQVDEDEFRLFRTGTHSDLFG